MHAARHPGVLMLRILLRERNFDVKSKWMSPNAAQSDFMRETRGLSLLFVMGMAGATGGGISRSSSKYQQGLRLKMIKGGR
ncbi:hypothetical protein DmGdi_25400 [Gluconobacter sp. Gdi]|nr:hypothetical protein DmGdi_25400 [Gluconobacter sp. Gdi]